MIIVMAARITEEELLAVKQRILEMSYTPHDNSRPGWPCHAI